MVALVAGGGAIAVRPGSGLDPAGGAGADMILSGTGIPQLNDKSPAAGRVRHKLRSQVADTATTGWHQCALGVARGVAALVEPTRQS